MVNLSEVNKIIQDSLNDNNPLGVEFKLFLDTGKFRKSIRRYNTVTEIVNGVTSVINSDIQKTNDGLILATYSLKTELVFKCKDEEEDIKRDVQTENGIVTETIQGNQSYLENIRAFLDEFCQESSFTLLTDKEGNTFDTSYNFGFSSGGNRAQVPNLGDSFTFILYGYFNFVQNGDNSLRWQYYLDGERIPYLVSTPRRTPTTEFDVYANTKDGSAKGTTSNTVWGLSLKTTSLIGNFSKAIKNFLLKGERNTAHFLDCVLGNESKIYLVMIGDSSASAQGMLNVGLDVTFAEITDDYDLIEFPETFFIYNYSGQGGEIPITNGYAFSTADYEPKKDGILSLVNGCYVVSTVELTNNDLTRL